MTISKAMKISPENIIADWGSVEDWAQGTSVAPSDWAMVGTAGSVARESTIIKQGIYSMKIISGASATYAAELSVADYSLYAGRTIKFGMWIYCGTASKARIYIDDGVTAVAYSSYHTGDSTWQFLEVQLQVAGSNSELTFGAQVAATTITAYFDGGVAVIGETIFTALQSTSVYLYTREVDVGVSTGYKFSSFDIARREGKYIPETKPGEKTVKITVQLFGDTFAEVRTNYDALMKQLLDGKKDLYISDERILKVFLSGIPKIRYEADFQVYYVDLNFIAPNPAEQYCARLRKLQAITGTVSFNVPYLGSYQSRPKITITASGGTINANNITVENLTSQQSFAFGGTISNAQSLIIDSDEQTVENNAVDASQFFTGDFIFLVPGTNYLKFTGFTNTFKLDYFDRWI